MILSTFQKIIKGYFEKLFFLLPIITLFIVFLIKQLYISVQIMNMWYLYQKSVKGEFFSKKS
jgi:hypothetical protein